MGSPASSIQFPALIAAARRSTCLCTTFRLVPTVSSISRASSGPILSRVTTVSISRMFASSYFVFVATQHHRLFPEGSLCPLVLSALQASLGQPHTLLG